MLQATDGGPVRPSGGARRQTMLRLVHDHDQPYDDQLDPIPFPVDDEEPDGVVDTGEMGDDEALDFAASPDEILEAIDDMSRHIDDLAREFNCGGHFEDDYFDDDRPRAA